MYASLFARTSLLRFRLPAVLSRCSAQAAPSIFILCPARLFRIIRLRLYDKSSCPYGSLRLPSDAPARDGRSATDCACVNTARPVFRFSMQREYGARDLRPETKPRIHTVALLGALIAWSSNVYTVAKAWSISAMMSSTASMPQLKRMRSGPIPAATSSSSFIWR